jgi:glutamate racemase
MLACTHYPIVIDRFAACYPNITWFNPGIAQADAVKALLVENTMLNPKKQGTFTLPSTSGDPAVYADIANRLGLFKPDVLGKLFYKRFPCLTAHAACRRGSTNASYSLGALR